MYYVISGYCFTFEIYAGGKVLLDNGNVGCNHAGASTKTYELATFTGSTGDVALWQGLWTVSAVAEEDPTATTVSRRIIHAGMTAKVLDIAVVLPTCNVLVTDSPSQAPSLYSTNCKVENFMGQTYYVKSAFFCWKFEVFEGGTVQNDPTNIECTSENTGGQGLQVLSYFARAQDRTAVYEKGDIANGWDGTIFWVEDNSQEGVSFKVIGVADNLFNIQISEQHCYVPSTMPSSTPSSTPSLLPS